MGENLTELVFFLEHGGGHIYDIWPFFDAKIPEKKYRTLCGHLDDQKSDIVRPKYMVG